MRAIDFQFSPWYSLRRCRCVQNTWNLVVVLVGTVSEMDPNMYYIGEVEMDIDVVTDVNSFLVRDCTSWYKYFDLECHNVRVPA